LKQFIPFAEFKPTNKKIKKQKAEFYKVEIEGDSATFGHYEPERTKK